jgi:hypothetical protein
MNIALQHNGTPVSRFYEVLKGVLVERSRYSDGTTIKKYIKQTQRLRKVVLCSDTKGRRVLITTYRAMEVRS